MDVVTSIGDDAVTAGTTGKGLQMEALKIYLVDGDGNSVIVYRANVSNIGWQSWVKNGQTAGTTGQSKQLRLFR